MCYPQAKNTTVCIEPPVYRRVAPSNYVAPPADLYNARETILWGDKAPSHKLVDEYTRVYKQSEEAAAKRAEQDAEQLQRENRLHSAVFLEKAQLEEFSRVETAGYEEASAIADPVERSKAWLKRLTMAKEFDVLRHTQALRAATTMLLLPAFSEERSARITKTVTEGKGSKKKIPVPVATAPELALTPEPAPAKTVYVESATSAAVPVTIQTPLTSQTSKERAKRQWVMDAIRSTGFSFKTAEECASKRRLADHYISKEDLLRVLEQTPEVTARLPPHYLSATKEELCGYLFKEPV